MTHDTAHNMTQNADEQTTDARAESSEAAERESALWAGDLGELSEQSRRALLSLVKGPYLSGNSEPRLWAALMADTTAIRSRLNDLFLELVVDRTDEFAFVRPAASDRIAVPAAVRTTTLSFMDTLMLLVLRQHLLGAGGDARVIVGKSEIFEQLETYRIDRDETDFTKRMNSSWTKMTHKLGILHGTGDDDRAEISPVLKVLLDDERVRSLTTEYERAVQEETS